MLDSRPLLAIYFVFGIYERALRSLKRNAICILEDVEENHLCDEK